MPPMYDWRCKACGKEETILTQSFDDYNKPPEEEKDEKCEKHDWEKQMGTFKLTRGANWTGRKGSW